MSSLNTSNNDYVKLITFETKKISPDKSAILFQRSLVCYAMIIFDACLNVVLFLKYV